MAKKFLSKVETLTPVAAGAGFSLPHGATPSAPANGDVWTTSAGVYVQVNGATVGPLGSASVSKSYAARH